MKTTHEFVKECRRQGIAPGFSYCLWAGPKWMPHATARAAILAQLQELAVRYGEIPYFPTDVLNGEVHLPPTGGHQPWRVVDGKQYYLPFEFEPVSQRTAKSTVTPWRRIGAWFTVRDSEPFAAEQLFDWIQQAVSRGADNVLLSCAPDHTGQFREEDVRQLKELGDLLRDAGLLQAQLAK